MKKMYSKMCFGFFLMCSYSAYSMHWAEPVMERNHFVENVLKDIEVRDHIQVGRPGNLMQKGPSIAEITTMQTHENIHNAPKVLKPGAMQAKSVHHDIINVAEASTSHKALPHDTINLFEGLVSHEAQAKPMQGYAINLADVPASHAIQAEPMNSSKTIAKSLPKYVTELENSKKFAQVDAVVPELLATYAVAYTDTMVALKTPQEFAQDTHVISITNKGINPVRAGLNIVQSGISMLSGDSVAASSPSPWIDPFSENTSAQNMYKGLVFLNDFFMKNPHVETYLSPTFTSSAMAEPMQNYVIALRAKYPKVSDKVLATFVTVFFESPSHRKFTPVQLVESIKNIEHSFLNDEGYFTSNNITTDVQKMCITMQTIQDVNAKHNAKVDAVTQKALDDAARQGAFTSNRQAVGLDLSQIWNKREQVNAATEAIKQAEAQLQQIYVADLANKSVRNLVETEGFDLAENIAYMKNKISLLDSSGFDSAKEQRDLREKIKNISEIKLETKNDFIALYRQILTKLENKAAVHMANAETDAKMELQANEIVDRLWQKNSQEDVITLALKELESKLPDKNAILKSNTTNTIQKLIKKYETNDMNAVDLKAEIKQLATDVKDRLLLQDTAYASNPVIEYAQVIDQLVKNIENKKVYDKEIKEIVDKLDLKKSDILTQIRKLQDLQDLQKNTEKLEQFTTKLKTFNDIERVNIKENQINDVIAKLIKNRDITWTGTGVNALLDASSSLAQGASDLAQYVTGAKEKSVELAPKSVSEKAPSLQSHNILLQVNPGATRGERLLYRIVENIFTVYGFIAAVGGTLGTLGYVCKEEVAKIIRKASFMILETQNNNKFTGDEKKKANNEIIKGMVKDIANVVIADKIGADVGVIAATGIAQGDKSSLTADAQSVAMSAAINKAIASLSPDDNAGYAYDKNAVSSGSYTSNLDKIQQQYHLKFEDSLSLSLSESEPSYDFSSIDLSPSYDYSFIYPSYQELLDMELEHNASLAS